MVSEEIKGAALLSGLGAVPGLRPRLTHKGNDEHREARTAFAVFLARCGELPSVGEEATIIHGL